jgi:hypothetical protein
MSILEFLNRAVSFLGSILPYGFGLLMILTIWGYMSQEEYNDDEITFTVSCKTVLSDMDHYPNYVLNYCMDRRSELK